MIGPQYKHWKLRTDENGIAWCHIDVMDSSTNILSSEVLDEFSSLLDGIEANRPTGLVILSDKKNGFIAGADIKEFTQIKTEKDAMELLNRGHSAFNKLDALNIPPLALINGYCLGGGLELALACDYRIVMENDRIKIGLPEVLLGIHPGFGGSMRLIRLIGPVKALPLMMQGRTLNVSRARKMGIVDYVVPERQFIGSASLLIQRRPKPARAGRFHALPDKFPLRSLLASYMQKQLSKRIRREHYPAPFALLDVWEKHGDNPTALLRAEALSVASLVNNQTSHNLVRVFLLQERMKSQKGLEAFKPRNVQVIGAGIMGGDIASWCVLQGMTVGLQDREPKFIAPAIKRAYKLYQRKLKHPRVVQNTMDRLIPDIASYHTSRADVVIEAIIENIEAKAALFKDIEPRLKQGAVLASNTSSIALEILGESLKDPSRLVGIHFFNPVARMQLVEVIYGKKTAEEWLQKAEAFCCSIGRLPLRVKSSPGFLVNRILTPYLMEAMLLNEEGVRIEVIDKVAVDFGMPMGPVELADTVGLDICLSVAENLSGKLNLSIPDTLKGMVEKGQLGKKSGSGFYQYRNGKAQKKKSDLSVINRRDIEDRLVLRMLNECAASLREGIVEDADMLDAGMIFGTGFPPFRGGPMNYAQTRGYNEIFRALQALETRLGERFNPDEYWNTLAQTYGA
jgi:3-hydroxyacyl-CoA dehydrogenase/enoyl-CoA hydratase/3-hydroxybutyryl-CoA epimerase